ncbi:MAG: ribonuclease H-like domain-containing protein, partial [Chloroflexi bacterium]|nr:ribonuclease H-like domain-containing protein [Chloroflexota bacterium]
MAEAVTPLPAAPRAWIAGGDESKGIVSVSADTSGLARVWRRIPGGGVAATDHRFPNWFLATDLELVGHMPVREIASAALGGAGDELADVGALGVVQLEDEPVDAYRFLVLTERLAEVEAAILDTYNKRVSGQLQSLAELRGLVLVLPPVEQFLVLTGRTYFKGLAYDDLVRLQFDLETTGLDEQRDRIFMISMRDNRGWRACLDISAMSEQALLGRFVELVRERDPDVLENHNIFAFDLPFLVRRAASLGVHLALGRDGSVPRPRADVFRASERSEPFTRWEVTGREVVDTQHAVRRYASETPGMRRQGLKDAARYFGFAATDREYVPGPDIWATYQTDPERVRRYAAHDVDEVDG